MSLIWNNRNSWAQADGHTAWLYCDADAYYKAFVSACRQARSHIYITGWDIHSETHLAPDQERSWIPRRWSLNRFLHDLINQRPELHVYILPWDFSPIYFMEREKLQSLRFSWLSHPRLHFQMDAAHPLGASQHQKIVVVDEALAFLGGIDLTIRRWDTCEHHPHHPLRCDPDGIAYQPFHDIQLGLTGPMVARLSELFRDRWLKAKGEILSTNSPLREPIETPAPEACALTFDKAYIALSRTLPIFREAPAILEIAHLYEDLLHSARHSILIENQYLTSRHIVRTIREIIAEPDAPEVIIILPEKSGGWLEQKTMGTLQCQALAAIKQADMYQRVHVFYPHDRRIRDKNRYITVHSKMMVIDDRFFTIGSANMNNRSMGLDSECNATICADQDPLQRKQIRQLIAKLLAHHTEAESSEAEARLDQGYSLLALIDYLNAVSSRKTLKLFSVELVPDSDVSWVDQDFLDREQPAPIEIIMDRWGHLAEAMNRQLGLSPRLLVLLSTSIVALATAAAWVWSPLPHIFHPERLEGWIVSIESGRFWLIPFIYSLASIILIPINVLIVLTASIFPLGWALVYIALGIVANVSTGYILGHWAGRFIFRYLFGKRTRELLHRVGEGHFLGLVALRLLPVAPSALINLAAGAGQIPLGRFLSATLLGMAPGTLMLVVFQKSLIEALREPGVASILILILLGVGALLLYRWARRRFSHYGHA